MSQARLIVAVAFAFAVIPACANAQYEAPPPDPGFEYIFDGSATGSDASFDQWEFASSTAAASAAQGQQTLDPVEGAINPNASPFGAIWYPVRPFGDVVLKLQYQVEDTPTSTRNGGIMIRSPEVRYTGATTSEVLAQKPTGYNFDVCPGALEICGLDEPAPSTEYFWEGADGPFPPASDADPDNPFLYTGPYCARGTNTLDPPMTHNVTNLAGTGPLVTANNANNHRHWTQVYCGHEIQINETLTGGGPQPSGDPIKTGSVYGFRNLNAKQSKTNERLEKGVWHDMEIRMVGQQYTVLIDGEVINQFDNSIPKIASRNGDPPTMARQLAAGYIGLQTHGGNDRIRYREIQVKELGPGDLPVNVHEPKVAGSGEVGEELTCTRGGWRNRGPRAADDWFTWYRSNDIGPEHPRYRAPSQLDLGNFATPAEPEFGTQNLTWVDSLIVGEGQHYTPTADDVGKVIHCTVSVTRSGATVFEYARAPEIIPASENGD